MFSNLRFAPNQVPQLRQPSRTSLLALRGGRSIGPFTPEVFLDVQIVLGALYALEFFGAPPNLLVCPPYLIFSRTLSGFSPLTPDPGKKYFVSGGDKATNMWFAYSIVLISGLAAYAGEAIMAVHPASESTDHAVAHPNHPSDPALALRSLSRCKCSRPDEVLLLTMGGSIPPLTPSTPDRAYEAIRSRLRPRHHGFPVCVHGHLEARTRSSQRPPSGDGEKPCR